MNNEKDNVYDLVEDFYAHDEGWNTLLRQEYAEGFLRMEAWKGKKNSDLYRSWDSSPLQERHLSLRQVQLRRLRRPCFLV